jgi:pimeloyl-ACP methyl ester carboxylesterase
VQRVTSHDGTEIAFETSGEGPALVLVGGSLADHQFYVPLAQALAPYFTVYNFDRRGRGQSGDTKPYAVERELEDVAALLATTNEPVFMYGHSAGAALALRAVAAGLTVAKLALADPPFTPRGEDDEVAKADHARQAASIQALLEQGDVKGSVTFFLQDYGLAEEELEAMFQSPAGETMLHCAGTLPYDYALLGDGLVPTELAAKVNVPTLVMAAAAMPQTAQALVTVLSNAYFRAMETSAHDLPPADIAETLIEFFIHESMT